jgi:antirestriction protein ArdC
MTQTSDEWIQTQLARLTSHDDWLRILQIGQNFRTYSFSNQILIALQRPDATYVAGYRKWQQLGRQVNRSEKALRILAPLIKKVPDRHAMESSVDADDSLLHSQIVGFRPVPVFDVSQTSGDPFTVPAPQLLRGQSAEDWLLRLIDASPVPVAFVDTQVLGSANGRYLIDTHHIQIRNAMEPNQQVKTLVHELAHHFGLTHSPLTNRAWEECAAESTAFVFCSLLGLDTIDYSAAYVAHWAQAQATDISGLVQTVQARLRDLTALIPLPAVSPTASPSAAHAFPTPLSAAG